LNHPDYYRSLLKEKQQQQQNHTSWLLRWPRAVLFKHWELPNSYPNCSSKQKWQL
jgi:hypothetical protein